MAWLRRVYTQGKDLWQELSGVAKAAAVGVVLLLVIAVGWASRPVPDEYVRLPGQPFTGKDLKAVVTQLDELKVAYKQAADGVTLVVPRDQQLNARLALSQAGVPAPAGATEPSAMDIFRTEKERENSMLRDKEAELGRVIGSMGEIERAVVKLAIPKDTVFVGKQKPVTAAVMLETTRGKNLQPQQVEGVLRFVAMSVPGLDPEKVVVVDGSGRELSGKQGANSATATAQVGDLLNVEMAYKRELEEGLRASLERGLGVGNVSVIVGVSLDNTSTTQTVVTYPPSVLPGGQPAMQSKRDRQEFSEGSPPPPQPVAGVAANTPGPPVYPSVQSGPQRIEVSDVSTVFLQPGVSHVSDVRPAGRIVSKTASVLVNQSVVTPEKLDELRANVASALSIGPDKVTVTALPWNNRLQDVFQEKPPVRADTNMVIEAMLPGLLAAAVLAVLLWWWFRRRQAPAMATPAGVGPLLAMDMPVYPPDDVDMQPVTVSEQVAAPPPAPGPAAPPPRLARPPVPPREPATVEELLGEDFAQRMVEEQEKRRLREEVDKLVRSNPDLVASLVKIWLEDDK